MESIDTRIKKIEPYVVQFNAVAKESAYYLILQFPEKWTVPSLQVIKETYKVDCMAGNQPGSLIIGAEMADGYDCVFDAAEYIISFNKDIEERVVLLNKCISELKNIFGSRKLEELRSLRFTFGDKEETLAEIVAAKQIQSVQSTPAETEQVPVKKRGKKKTEKEPVVGQNKTNEDDSLLEFVESTL